MTFHARGEPNHAWSPSLPTTNGGAMARLDLWSIEPSPEGEPGKVTSFGVEGEIHRGLAPSGRGREEWQRRRG